MAAQPVLDLPLVVAMFALILISFDAKANAYGQFSNIGLGTSLSLEAKVTSWLSPSGVFAFGFYPQSNGFAIGIWMNYQPETTVVWTANRDDPPVSADATLELTERGLLLLHAEHSNQTLISYPLRNSATVALAAMLDSGNFVLYDNESRVIWESFDSPTDTMLGGQTLSSDSRLVSSSSSSNHSSGRYSLNMQGTDGNLVLYALHGTVSRAEDSYWATNTSGRHFSELCLHNNGSLYLEGSYGVFIIANGSSSSNNWPTSAGNEINGSEIIIYRATLDHEDGNFRLFSHHIVKQNSRIFLMWWALDNQRGALSKGICGLNSYYVVAGPNTYCNCYPGFSFVNPKNQLQGCYQQFIEDSCTDQDEDQWRRYNMSNALENVRWGDHPYSVIQLPEKDACSKSCLEDCNCRAVLYSSTNCNKYRLPLRYGKIIENISTTAFIKMVWETNSNGSSNHTPAVNSLNLILALVLGFIVGLSFVFAISSFVVFKYRDHRYKKLLENANLGMDEDFRLQSFSYDELEKATDGFKEELGRGTFGAVYKGTLPKNGKAIAVKRLEKVVKQGAMEFEAEMTAVTRTYHRNLVQLLGFCIEGSRKLLVYEFMSNGSLADHLFKATSRPTWRQRVKFILDVARGVLYLHQECGVHITLCNLKPQNILLDDTWTAKISDFGLAALLKPNAENMFMNSDESSGYFAPEWQRNSHISVKADIYSFGIVLLETVCCRRSIEVSDHLSPDEIMLSNLVYNRFVAGELDKLVEEDDDDVDARTLERTVKVGLWCIQDDPALRPVMKDVILMLEGTMDIPIPPSPGFPLAP